jgi:integrase
MTRRESPMRRINPSGRTVWIARATGPDGRKSRGTYTRRGPCKTPRDDGDCCAQHRIDWFYGTLAGTAPWTITVGDYLETWLDHHPRPERTAESYLSKARSVMDVPVRGVPFRDLELDGLRRSHVLTVLDHMLRVQGRAARGASSVLAVLSAMAEDAIGDDVAGANPFKGVAVRRTDPRVRKAPRAIRRLDWSEMHRIAALSGPHEPMLRVLSDCGLRLGEMLGLTRADWRRDVLVVEQVAWNGRLVRGTKTTHGSSSAELGRVVPVPPALQEMLRAMPKRIDSPMLFPSPRGGVWHAQNFRRRVWDPAVALAGVACTPHDFRHSWVSNLRAAGVDPADLADAAGHTVLTATAHYTHGVGASFETIRGAVG